MPISAHSLISAGLISLYASHQQFSQASERLSTGLRINRGADDPAGLIASEHMGKRLITIDSEVRSIERGNMSLAIEEGSLSALTSGINDLQSLIVRGSNTGAISNSESNSIASGADAAIQGLEYVSSRTGSDILSSVSIQREIGIDSVTGEPIYETLALSDLPDLIESDPASAQALISEANNAVATRRAQIGAEQRSNESILRSKAEEHINIARAQSEIRDTDYAKEVSEQLRASIIGTASIKTILIAQEQNKKVLDLL